MPAVRKVASIVLLSLATSAPVMSQEARWHSPEADKRGIPMSIQQPKLSKAIAACTADTETRMERERRTGGACAATRNLGPDYRCPPVDDAHPAAHSVPSEIMAHCMARAGYVPVE